MFLWERCGLVRSGVGSIDRRKAIARKTAVPIKEKNAKVEEKEK